MLRKVAVIALPDVAVFELGVLCELFGYDRTADGLPAYEFAVCTPERNACMVSLLPRVWNFAMSCSKMIHFANCFRSAVNA